MKPLMVNREMHKIPIIRKGTYLDYLRPGVMGGLLIAIILFLIALINNSALVALYVGLFIWIGTILFYMSVFAREEYFKRKRKIEDLLSVKYDFLLDNGFKLHDDLLFEGTYAGFYFRILNLTRRRSESDDIQYHVIQTFYTFDPTPDDSKKERNMSGDYYLGHLSFADHAVALLPKDWKKPDFKENFDELMILFGRLKLKPISKEDWEKAYGSQSQASSEQEKDAGE